MTRRFSYAAAIAAIAAWAILIAVGSVRGDTFRLTDWREKHRLRHASQLLSQATFGANMEEIEAAAQQGSRRWIEAQFNQPIGYHEPLVQDLIETFGIEGEEDVELPFDPFLYSRFAWWQQAMEAPDPLRQRVAFALSEILVISDRVADIADAIIALPNYYDRLLEGAFGNYRDLLLDVTLHPAMGVYLSHMNNRKADPTTGQFPDENYAREVMQLFSIGLFELHLDGSWKLDAQGQPIPTYTNREITEFAKVFTGLGSPDPDAEFSSEDELIFDEPMFMFEEFHEPGEKRLLNGVVIPAGQRGLKDIEDAIDNLFHHPNVGPFVGRHLIQRLVTSNPSPDYIRRVALAFNDNGNGERGDMKAVIRAILLDEEARQLRSYDRPTFGHLQEPILRYLAICRAFNASSPSGWFYHSGHTVMEWIQQHPLNAPSVFNFFSPEHQPNGPIADAGLVAPEFQITTSTTIVGMTNLIDLMIFEEEVMDVPIYDCDEEEEPEPGEEECIPPPLDPDEYYVTLDLSREIDLAANPDALIDHLALLLTHDGMSHGTRTIIRDAIVQLDDEEDRARLAIYLALISPDYAVAN